VTLVGGNTQVGGKFEENLMEWGVEVCQHIEYLPLRVPAQATAIVVIKTFCSHSLFHAAQLQAKKRGLLLVAVEHNWVQAGPMLQQHGLLEQVPESTWEEASTQAHVFPILSLVKAEVAALADRVEQAEDLLLEKDDQVEALARRVKDVLADPDLPLGEDALLKANYYKAMAGKFLSMAKTQAVQAGQTAKEWLASRPMGLGRTSLFDHMQVEAALFGPDAHLTLEDLKLPWREVVIKARHVRLVEDEAA